MPVVDAYENAVTMKGADSPAYVIADADKRRIQAYWTYENLYSNVWKAFAGVLRDTSDEPMSRRLLPVARAIIEGTNRYLANDPEIVVPSEDMFPIGMTPPTPEMAKAAVSSIQQLFSRERMESKLASVKRWTLVRGDGVFHITADPIKDPGSRISIHELHPDSYFPIHYGMDNNRVIGCYLVNILTIGRDEIAQRLEYRKISTQEDAAKYRAPLGSIYSRVTFWESDGWDDRDEMGLSEQDLKPAPTQPSWTADLSYATILEGAALPSSITAIPVYHFRNPFQGTGQFGVSELNGIETVLAGINQTATDEDLAVVLQGIGTYWTDSGHPKDEAGNDVPWVISPASILELEKDGKIGRIEGANDIESLLKHIDLLRRAAQDGTGTPDVAVGSIERAVAESGVALAIRFAPIVAKNGEKESEISSTMNQMLYDLLNGWFPAFEALQWPGVVLHLEFGDPLPVDRAATLDEILQMVSTKIISLAVARQIIQERLGYQFPTDMDQQIVNEQQALLDATGARLDGAITDTRMAI